MFPLKICSLLSPMSHAKIRRMRAHSAQGSIAECSSKQQLLLIICQSIIGYAAQNFITDTKFTRRHFTARGEDHMIRCGSKASPSSRSAFHLELQKLIGATIIKPSYDAAWFYNPPRRIVGKHFNCLTSVNDPTDFLAAPISEEHAGVVMKTPKHYAYLLANLVDEDQTGVRPAHDRRQFAQRLRHQPRLQAGQAVAHIAFEFGARGERRYGVDHQHVNRVRPHQ